MEHDLELFNPILGILEIEVCNIIYNPGNIGKRIFSLSPILEIVDRTIHICSYVDVAGGRRGSRGVAGDGGAIGGSGGRSLLCRALLCHLCLQVSRDLLLAALAR